MKDLKIIKAIVERLLSFLKLEATIDVLEDKENEAVRVQIETSQPGILIGYHGETLAALQLILGIMVNQKIDKWIKIIVNVGDYRQKREEVLKRMALSAAQRVHFSGEPVVLLSLSAFERRIIHLALADHLEVETSSEGEGKERRLVIRPRQSG